MNLIAPRTTHLHWWRPAAWLRITGEDAANFLQGQFTNDLRGLGASGGAAVYGLWLDVKGKVLADSFVLRGAGGGSGVAGPEFWVGSYFSAAAVIRTRLESHVIADDVTIEDLTADWAGVSLFGDGATEGLPAQSREGFIFPGRRTREKNTEWVFPVAALDAVRRQLAGWPELETSELVRLRIAAGLPAVPAEVGPGDLPNEGALEADAISYTKGCYLGQEVMARLKSMGQVRRRLLRVSGAAAAWPALPAPLFLGERKVGELRSAVSDAAGGFVGRAMLSLLHLTPGARLAWAANAPPAVKLEDAP